MFVSDPENGQKAEVAIEMWCVPREAGGADMVVVFAIQENELWTVYRYDEVSDRDVPVHPGVTLEAAKALIVILGAAT